MSDYKKMLTKFLWTFSLLRHDQMNKLNYKYMQIK